MSETQPLGSWHDFVEVDDATYLTTIGWGNREVVLGSLSAEDMVEWMEENQDPEKQKRAGLRLLAKAIVFDAEVKDGKLVKGSRLPAAKHEQFIDVAMKKNPRTNGQLVATALRMNGMELAAGVIDKANTTLEDVSKNGSSEAGIATLPTASPLPQDV